MPEAGIRMRLVQHMAERRASSEGGRVAPASPCPYVAPLPFPGTRAPVAQLDRAPDYELGVRGSNPFGRANFPLQPPRNAQAAARFALVADRLLVRGRALPVAPAEGGGGDRPAPAAGPADERPAGDASAGGAARRAGRPGARAATLRSSRRWRPRSGSRPLPARTQSESWISAQTGAFGRHCRAQADGRGAGDIDALGATTLQTQGGIAPNDLKAIDSAAAEVASIARRQTDRIAAVQRRLGPLSRRSAAPRRRRGR